MGQHQLQLGVVTVTDSMVLPVTSGHVSNTSCKSCEFVVRSRSSCCMYSCMYSGCLILYRCETSRFEPLNPAKRPITLPSHTGNSAVAVVPSTDVVSVSVPSSSRSSSIIKREWMSSILHIPLRRFSPCQFPNHSFAEGTTKCLPRNSTKQFYYFAEYPTPTSVICYHFLVQKYKVLSVRKQDVFNKNITQGKIWKHNSQKKKNTYVSLYTLHTF